MHKIRCCCRMRSSSVCHEGIGYENRCKLSIVLEDDAALYFSAIRILVLYKPQGPFNYVEMRERLDASRLDESWNEAGARYRQSLMLRRKAAHRSQNILSDNNKSICNVIFDLVDLTDQRYSSYGLQLRPQSQLRPMDGLHVAYDHVYPTCSARPYLQVTLNTSHAFRSIPIPALHNDYDPMKHRSHMMLYTIYVIPTCRKKQSFAFIPHDLIRRIVKLTFDEKHAGWRTVLLSYGLVCKSWSTILDLAIGGFDELDDLDKPGALAVARVLKANPVFGTSIHIFDPTIYEYPMETSGERSFKKWNAVLEILMHANRAHIVRLSSIHSSVAKDLLYILKKFRNIRYCRVQAPNPKNKLLRGGYILTMSDVQTAIAEWDQLKMVELHNWRDEDLWPSSSLPQSRCQLQMLLLEKGKLYESQLMFFVPASYPSLQELCMKEVRGLRNQDFRVFLAAVAHSISKIIVLQCIFSRDVDEEFALDAAMPNLSSLETLSADGGSVSALAISRRPLINSTASHDLHGSISIEPAGSELALREVAEAMKVTTWKAIRVIWASSRMASTGAYSNTQVPTTSISGFNESDTMAARQVAGDRGIMFTYKT